MLDRRVSWSDYSEEHVNMSGYKNYYLMDFLNQVDKIEKRMANANSQMTSFMPGSNVVIIVSTEL